MHTESKICEKGGSKMCVSSSAALSGHHWRALGNWFWFCGFAIPETSRLLSSEIEANVRVKYKGFPGIAAESTADK